MEQQVVGNATRTIDGNRESESHRAAARRVDGAVHADDFAGCIDERSTGVTRVDGRVGLDHVHIHAAPFTPADEIATDRADHADGDTGLGIAEHEAVRIANRDRPLADGEIVGTSKRCDGERLRRDAQHGDIVLVVFTHERRRIGRAVAHHDGDLRGAADNVGVRDDDAIGAHHEAGADACARSLAGATAKEVLERIDRNALHRFRLHGDHRGRDALDGGRDRGPPRGGNRLRREGECRCRRRGHGSARGGRRLGIGARRCTAFASGQQRRAQQHARARHGAPRHAATANSSFSAG
ncbi:MAG: hypothetical protein MUF00_21485 [Gemmatimonadaceae bacterium]|nr:hypothetical protein [Gemmatimonadaceae bacterium]